VLFARSPRRSVLPHVPWRSALRRARRAAAAWWMVAAVAAGLAGSHAFDAAGAAADARSAWGESVEVAVAARDLEVGHVVSALDVALEARPRAVVPAGALEEVPLQRVVVSPVAAGEVVVGARVAPDGLTGIAALVPAGHRAVAVPVDGSLGAVSPAVRVGDRVDVLATFDVVDPSGPPAGVVTAGVTVVAVDATTVTLAVSRDDTPRVVFAAARGTVALAIVGAD
jgi:Flp pilus assembly protein CpaB